MTKTIPFPLAVIFDWAGTTVDYGSLAPTTVFREVFHRRGIEITVAEARGPMGRAKLDHIAEIAGLPRVGELWRQVHDRLPTAEDVQSMYHEFLPLQKEILQHGSDVIPGVPEVVDALRGAGCKIGSSTGYTRELMEVVAPIAARQGYAPDTILCADDVLAGRPAPWMNFRVVERLVVYPMKSIVVVDDTQVGIEAGRNAGACTAAISMTGNALGLSEAEVAALPADQLRQQLAVIEQDFLAAGADMVIRSVAELLERLPELEQISASAR